MNVLGCTYWIEMPECFSTSVLPAVGSLEIDVSAVVEEGVAGCFGVEKSRRGGIIVASSRAPSRPDGVSCRLWSPLAADAAGLAAVVRLG